MNATQNGIHPRSAALFLMSAMLVAFPASAQKSGAAPGPRTPSRPGMLPSKPTQSAPRPNQRAPNTTPPRRSSAPEASPARPVTSPTGTNARPAPRNETKATAAKTASRSTSRRVVSNLGPAEYSPNGPGTVAPRRHALSAGAGWPGAEIGYLYGFRENLSLGATINVGYGTGIAYTGGNFALMGTVKWRFAKLGPLDAGVRFSLGYFLGPTYESYSSNVPGHGVAIDAAFLLHYQIMKRLSIEPYFAMPIRMAFNANSSTVVVPLYVGVAAEYMVIPRLKLFLRLGVGGAAVLQNGTDPQSKSGEVNAPGTKGTVWIDAMAGVGYAF